MSHINEFLALACAVLVGIMSAAVMFQEERR